MSKTLVLIMNLGSPDEPTKKALKRYLLEFLSDYRVIERQGLLWQLILRGIILNTRPKKSAAKYQKIWLANGASPLLHYTKALTAALNKKIGTARVDVDFAMRYGNPDVSEVLDRHSDIDTLIVLPLYPQYSMTTTASCLDAVYGYYQKRSFIPSIHFINDYYRHEVYIKAIADSIKQHWHQFAKAEMLLFSFHGLPQSYIEKGDPYYDQCLLTAKAIAESLALEQNHWRVSFQSRFGVAKWLKPATDITLKQLADSGIRSVDIICPGFAVDCLETLEEIAIENRKMFLEAKGHSFHYIGCLNDNKRHVELLTEVIAGYLSRSLK
ncbi:MAG: ferrochelatase [Francisellaceae bacterium]